jgi:hypothetical protein
MPILEIGNFPKEFGMVFEQCRDILLEESELVQRIGYLQELIQQAVMNRSWTDFEGHFNALSTIKTEFTTLESERERLFDNYARFYALTAQLPAEQRAELTSIYRSLKLETLRVRMSGEALMSYIADARAAMNDFFEVAFPDRGGKIYTPHGVPVSHDMRSMVLNRAF